MKKATNDSNIVAGEGGFAARTARVRRALCAIPLAAALAVCAPEAGAQCRESAASFLPMPSVTWLRGYRADLNSPARLAIDASDTVYIADPKRGSVTARALDGSILLDRRDLGRPSSVAVDVGGRIFVGDGDSGRVTAYDAAWVPLFHLGAGAGEFGHPGDIAIDPASGEVYVSDTARHRVRVYAPSGTFAREIGAPSPTVSDMLSQPNPLTTKAPEGTFRSPTGLAVSGGELLVSDQMNYRVQAFDRATGAYLYCVGTYREGGFFNATGGARPRFFGMAQGIWADGQGRVFITDSFEGVVRVVDLTNGSRIGTIGSFGEDAGALRVPTDVVVDRLGRLFVASADNGRVEIFGLGSFSDPETRTPAALALAPATLDRFSTASQVELRLEVPDHRVGDIDRASVRVNGLSPTGFSEGDPDGDGIRDLLISMPGPQLLATLPPPEAAAGTVTVTGSVGPLQFSASAIMSLTAVVPDTDGDGVSDRLDRCPGTLAGSEIDAFGCSISQRDDDGDGVPNSNDFCAGTPAGNRVDSNGCSDAQKDADGDGVADALDQCPGTPAAAIADGAGCSIAQHCPCSGPRTGGKWRNQGEFVSCVSERASMFRAAGLIASVGAVVSEAARSACGR